MRILEKKTTNPRTAFSKVLEPSYSTGILIPENAIDNDLLNYCVQVAAGGHIWVSPLIQTIRNPEGKFLNDKIVGLGQVSINNLKFDEHGIATEHLHVQKFEKSEYDNIDDVDWKNLKNVPMTFDVVDFLEETLTVTIWIAIIDEKPVPLWSIEKFLYYGDKQSNDFSYSASLYIPEEKS